MSTSNGILFHILSKYNLHLQICEVWTQILHKSPNTTMLQEHNSKPDCLLYKILKQNKIRPMYFLIESLLLHKIYQV